MNPIYRADLPMLAEHRNDESTWAYLSDASPVWSHKQDQWLESLGGDRMYFLAFVSPDKGQYIAKQTPTGFLRLTDIDWLNGTAMIGLDVFKSFRGKGHSFPIMEMFIKYVFDNFRIRKLSLLVVDGNRAAQKTYDKCGFVTEGNLKDHIYRNGEYHDYVYMSLFREEYYGDPAI